MYKETLVKDLNRLAGLETAAYSLARRMTGIGIAVVFLAIVWVAASVMTTGVDNQAFIIAAGVVGGYMAINIGANDVANNVAPAVGAKSLTMAGALIIAGIFESAGAIIAGGDVVKTISKDIIDASLISEPRLFMWAMLAALLAAALWINFATYVNAPVSTTHSIVGAVMGAGIAAAGVAVVDWKVMAAIAASWIVSPLLGGVIAALFLAFVKSRIIYQPDKVAGAKRWVPVLVALMAGVFSSYLVMKGLKHMWKAGPWTVAALGVAVYGVTYAVVRPLILRRARGMENRNKSIRALFHLPLIFAAALLSFAHGSNDVANAVGPLAAIVAAATTHDVKAAVGIPPWVMFVGAAGITMGLLLFGPRLIRVVGDQITRMNPMRAYCVALSAAITVIVASALGLPISSTHIAVGAVFGVGFLREYYTTRRTHIIHGRVMKAPKPPSDWERLPPMEKARRRKLVRRQHLWTIIAAWLITVPLSAGFAAAIFLALATFLG
ncbi:MAG: inorganic phosphate transporter [Rhodospirillales bacterium]|nr:inorganic phosphate transporter [Rhodospirillales bacterium]